MGKEISTKVKIKLEKDMIFKCQLGGMKVEDCYIDDTHEVETEMWGPNPARLLGMALLGCLSASYIFCLKKRNITTEDLEATGKVIIGRNEKGFVRIKRVDVTIDVKIQGEKMRKRAEQCKKMFEQYCTVTAAVVEGIEVNVNINL
ncbi:MAG: OsmC family protein [Candidatus Lokiarchaeia archaeon]